MKISKDNYSTKVSVPLNCLNVSTIKRIAQQKCRNNMIPLHPINTNLAKEQPYKMYQTTRKKDLGEGVSSSSRESDAHLLLSLSNNSLLDKNINKSEHLPDYKNNEEDPPIKKTTSVPPDKDTEREESPEVIVLDEDINDKNSNARKDTVKQKCTASIPMNRKIAYEVSVVPTFLSKNPKTSRVYQRRQTIQKRLVSRKDFEIFKLIKEKRLTRLKILNIMRRLTEIKEVHQRDLNNNDASVHGGSLRGARGISVDDETFNKVVNHSNQNKAFAYKIFQLSKQNRLDCCCHRWAYQQINLTNMIRELLEKFAQKFPDLAVKTSIGKTTQTDIKIMKDVGCATGEQSSRPDGGTSQQPVLNVATDNNQVGEPAQAHPIQSSPIPGDQANGSQSLPHPPVEPQYQPINSYNPGLYPSTRMISALELTEPVYQQQGNYNRAWNVSYMRPTQAQQIPILSAMGKTTATETSHTLVPHLTTTAMNHAPPMTTQAFLSPRQTTPNSRWQVSQRETQEPPRTSKNRRVLKNTPPRSAPYTTGGPRFPRPSVGKYQMLMERQRMDQQQKIWESQLHNYPNTAWDHMYRANH